MILFIQGLTMPRILEEQKAENMERSEVKTAMWF